MESNMAANTSADANPVLNLLTREALVEALSTLDDAYIADMAREWWRGNGAGIRFWMDTAAFRAGLPSRWELPDTIAAKCGTDVATACIVSGVVNSPVVAQ